MDSEMFLELTSLIIKPFLPTTSFNPPFFEEMIAKPLAIPSFATNPNGSSHTDGITMIDDLRNRFFNLF